MIPRAIVLFGTEEPVPKRVALRAGPVSATLEDGALRWIRLKDVEVIRAIAFLIRDRNWSTPSPEVTALSVEQSDSGFRVTFDALCRTNDGELPWSAEIVGEANGTIRFTGTAKPAHDFLTQRTGFVILHPLAGVAGRPVAIANTDGATVNARFPDLVDPEECFTGITALSYEVSPGITATCAMEGDVWEMEDHRNWLDASFKTYVRPLALPHPYTIDGGSTVTQNVTLSFSGATIPATPVMARHAPITIAVGRPSATCIPAIALRAPLQRLSEAGAIADFGRKASAQIVSGRIDPRLGHGPDEIRKLGEIADLVGARLALELVVPCRQDPANELSAFAAGLRNSGVCPESVMITLAEDRIRLEPGPPLPPSTLLAGVHQAARRALPDVPIGGGTIGFFAELNRNWPPAGLIDFVGHTSCSVVHAADDRTVMENLESFRHIARTVRAFAGDLPYRLIAVGIAADSYLEGPPTPNPDNRRRTSVRMDPRHRALFGAAWTLAAIGEAARGGLQVIGPAAFVGEFGIVHRQLDYAQPWFDEQTAPTVYPVFHVVAGMARAAGQPVATAISSDETRIATIAHSDAEGGTCVWLANLTDETQRVSLAGGGTNARISRLDESAFETAATYPAFMQSRTPVDAASGFEIGAYGVASIQIGGDSG